MNVYYNDNDPRAAAWLRQLILDGRIPAGDVDERSITDVEPADLAGYRHVHFFAGIGGWAIAAQLAGWPADRELWSASCPCQPFSVAGKGKGTADARHLWPDVFRLASARRPAFIVGEQVAAAIGKDWFDGVRSDMEGIGYACRGAVVPACAVNAPHRRDRLWFVARSRLLEDAAGSGNRRSIISCEIHWPTPGRPASRPAGSGGGNGGNVDISERARLEGYAGDDDHEAGRQIEDRSTAKASGGGAVPDAASERRDGGQGAAEQTRRALTEVSGVSNVAHHDSDGRQPWQRDDTPARYRHPVAATGGTGHWDGAKWLIGHDGKARRVEPSLPLLVDGLPHRASLLRGYGNAIVPAVAAEVLAALMEDE